MGDATVLRRLRHARRDGLLVRVFRSPRFADPIDGCVAQIGKKWVLMSVTADGGHRDGWTAVRLKDVTKVTKDRSFQAVFAASHPLWPPRPPEAMNLDTTTSLLRFCLSRPGLIAIADEARVKDATWVGRVVALHGGRLHLRQIDTQGRWDDELHTVQVAPPLVGHD